MRTRPRDDDPHARDPLARDPAARTPWPRAREAFEQPRLRREARTMQAMIDIYCRRVHAPEPVPCPECRELLDYAMARLEKCPFQSEKPTCAHCAIHCYRPDMRERVRLVMRRAGPHMAYRHPHLAFLHLVVDARRRPPEAQSRRRR